jgi:pyrroloquinoline quinone biosynthesis protein A
MILMSSVRVFEEWFGIVRVIHFRRNLLQQVNNLKTRILTMWTKPEVTEMRFGFEVTMYVCNR